MPMPPKICVWRPMGTRIRLENGVISGLELVTYRTGSGPAWNDAGYAQLEEVKAPKTLWTDPVPPHSASRGRSWRRSPTTTSR